MSKLDLGQTNGVKTESNGSPKQLENGAAGHDESDKENKSINEEGRLQ